MTVLHILYVDDDPNIREVVEISMGLDPAVVMRSCGSGVEALGIVVNWPADIILLDVMMPVMDGPATLARLRENEQTANIPVVFMTARAQTRELDRLRSLGAAGVISKPFDPLTLAASVRAYVRPEIGDLDAARRHFLGRINDAAIVLAKHRAGLRNGAGATAAQAAIKDIAHGLAGASGMFGFPDIGRAAAALEEAGIEERGGSVEGILSALDQLLARIEASGHLAQQVSRPRIDA